MAVILPSVYRVGTATVAANGVTVTGQGTLWVKDVLPGDFFGVHKGFTIRIASVDSNTQLTLANAWPGAAQAAAAYEIMLQSDVARYSEALRQLLEKLSSGNVEALAGLVGAANKFPFFTGAGTMDVGDVSPYARSNIMNQSNRTNLLGSVNVSIDYGNLSRRATDLNLITVPGQTIAVSDTLNRPPVDGGYIVRTNTWENNALVIQEAIEMYPILGRRWFRSLQSPTWTGWAQQVQQNFPSVQENGGLAQNAVGNNKLFLGYSSSLSAPALTVDATNFGRVWTDLTCEFFTSGAFGYQRFATGLMIQWGQQVAGAADVQVNYPWAFTAAPFALLAQGMGAPASSDAAVTILDQSLPSLFVIRRRLVRNGGVVDASSSFTVMWMAIGRWR